MSDQERAPLIQRPQDDSQQPHVLNRHKKKETLLRAVLVTFLVGLVAYFIIRHFKKQAVKIQTCYSRECVSIAGEILADMDNSINPCNDFWAFSCGGYMKNHPITDDYGSEITFSYVDSKTYVTMRELLESNFDGVHNVDLTKDDRKYDRASWKKFQTYYDACISLNEENITSPALVPLINSVTTHFEFPSKHEKFNKSGFTIALSDLARVGINPFITARPGPSWEKFPEGNYELNIFPTVPWFWIGYWDSPSPYSSPKALTIDAARKIYNQIIAQVIGGVFDVIDPKYHTGKSVNDIVNDVIKFEETWLLAASAERENTYPPLYEVKPLKELGDIFSTVKWSLYFNSLIPSDVKLPPNVTVYSPRTIRKVDKLISDTEPHILMFILLWRGLFQAWYSNLQRWQYYAQKIDVATGSISIWNNDPHWRKCLSESMGIMPGVAGRTFIYDVLDPNAKKNVDRYVVEITDAYLSRFREVSWVNSTDKDALVEKIKATTWETVVIGNDPDLSSAKEVARSVKDFSVSSDSYVFNTLNYIEREIKEKWSKLSEPFEIPNLFKHTPVWMVNAFNIVWENHIVIPGGIVQKPWYSDDNPDYINFGAMGVILGHEAGHGFDQSFIIYDKEGNETKWVSDDLVKEVKRRAQCLHDQKDLYSKNYEYLNQLVSDQAGIRQSFTAWSKRGSRFLASNNRLLPGIDLTREQLFYVAYARGFCGNRRDGGKKVYLATNPVISAMVTEKLTMFQEADSFESFFSTRPYGGIRITSENKTKEVDPVLTYRVNVGVRNLPGFAAAYNCPVGSPMNPENKCEIW